MENNNFKPFPFEQLKQKKEPEKTAVAIAYEPGEKDTGNRKGAGSRKNY